MQSDFTNGPGYCFEALSVLRRFLQDSRPEKAIIALQNSRCAGQQFMQSDGNIYRVSSIATENSACLCPQIQESLHYSTLLYAHLLSYT